MKLAAGACGGSWCAGGGGWAGVMSGVAGRSASAGAGRGGARGLGRPQRVRGSAAACVAGVGWCRRVTGVGRWSRVIVLVLVLGAGRRSSARGWWQRRQARERGGQGVGPGRGALQVQGGAAGVEGEPSGGV